MMHPDEARLNDYADGLLAGDDSAALAVHLERCGPCRNQVAAIQALAERLAALPRELPPARDLRPSMPTRPPISDKGDAVPTGAAPAAGSGSGRGRAWLQAAAVVGLVVAAAAVGRLATAPEPVSLPSGPAAAPAAGLAELVPEDAYAEASRALRGLLDERRTAVPPEAARLVERNVAAVDNAIRELESARARHPADPALARMLDQQYRTRLELLRSAVALLEG